MWPAACHARALGARTDIERMSAVANTDRFIGGLPSDGWREYEGGRSSGEWTPCPTSPALLAPVVHSGPLSGARYQDGGGGIKGKEAATPSAPQARPPCGVSPRSPVLGTCSAGSSPQERDPPQRPAPPGAGTRSA